MRFLVFLWLLLLSMLPVLSYNDHSFASGQCLEDQKAFLLQLKHNISFSSLASATSNLTSWDLNTDCCSSWEGISCDREGHVTGLDLNNKFISGVAQWSSLFELKYLISLNLSYNSFNSTPIPSGLDRLANLSYLNLSNSGFGGQVPIDVSRMKRLVLLDLSTLYAVPLRLENPDLRTLVRDLSELRELYLDGVNISMHGIEWSQAISSALPNLQVLSLSNCNLLGPPDQSLLKLRSLSILRLNLNKISAQIPDFIGKFSNLSCIYLSGCELRGKFPEQIFKLPLLRSLDVSANRFLLGTLPEFPLNSVLQNIVLSNTKFSGKLPKSIGNLRLLRKLEFQSCGFRGSIPSSMSNLTKLEYIDLSSNKFNGTVPNFSSSVNLTHLNLAQNQLTGISSSQWSKHLNLVNLNLRNNSINGTIPSSLFSLPSLQKLDLSQNQFTGSLPEFPDGSSMKLDTLDLSNNLLEGSIPISIFKIYSLKILALSSNKMNGTLELKSFQNLKNISSIDLSGNNMSIISGGTDSALFPRVGTLKLGSCNLRTIPGFLRKQTALIYLDLSNNQIRGKIPNWIVEIGNGSLAFLNLSSNSIENPDQPFPNDTFKSLAIVDLHSNLLQEPIPILPPLASFIDYSKNNIASSIPADIGSYLNFSISFSLSGNSFQGEIPSSLCNAKYLQVLDLSNNNLSGLIPECLGDSTTLSVLNLRNNQLNGTLPQTFQEKCNLRTLDLNGNKLAGEVPTTLANCANLEVLDLGHNQITGTFPGWLEEMTQLSVLVLRSNRFSGSIPPPHAPNKTFQKLQIIDLSSNSFTGNLPATRFSRWSRMKTKEEAGSNYKHGILKFRFLDLSRLYYQDAVTVTSKGLEMKLVKILTIFTSIDMSNNKFVGEIPEAIGNLTALYVLNLSHNVLTGSIPSSFGNLVQLESLDLSRNKLTGTIPSELKNLTFLSVLNLSFNRLVGRIPEGSQFPTFDKKVYEGNDRLCGTPLQRKCNSIPKLVPKFVPSTSKSKTEFDWEFIVTGVGFGGGLAWVVAPLWFWTEGRKWFDKQFTKLLLLLFPSVWLHGRRVDAITEDSLEEELTDDEVTESTYSYDTEEENADEKDHGRGRYCVFCTKVVMSVGRVIHDPKCSHLATPDSSFFRNPDHPPYVRNL